MKTYWWCEYITRAGRNLGFALRTDQCLRAIAGGFGPPISKFYLHISKEEQEQRLLEREKDSIKAWKLSVGDWKEREHWNDYTGSLRRRAQSLQHETCAMVIVPADKKWFRNLAIAEALRDALMPYKKKWLEKLEDIGREKRGPLKNIAGAANTREEMMKYER